MKKIIVIVAIVVVLLIGAVVAIRSNSNSNMGTMNMTGSDTSTSDVTETNKVTIEDYAFAPKAIKVKVGTTVTWTNNDTVKHNVVTEDGAPEAINGKLIGKGETYTYTFTKVGTYDYYCQPHPYMKGQVVVTE